MGILAAWLSDQVLLLAVLGARFPSLSGWAMSLPGETSALPPAQQPMLLAVGESPSHLGWGRRSGAERLLLQVAIFLHQGQVDL